MNKAHIYVVDDDDNFRKSLCALIESLGMGVESWGDGEELARGGVLRRPGCVVVDYRLPSLSGLDVLRAVREMNSIPFILISAYADVATTVAAIKLGAAEVFEKPIEENRFLAALARECFEDERRMDVVAECSRIKADLKLLSPAEQEVLDQIVAGCPNKVIAANLAKSVKTVERHRQNLMRKLHCITSAEILLKVLMCPAFARSPLRCSRGGCAIEGAALTSIPAAHSRQLGPDKRS